MNINRLNDSSKMLNLFENLSGVDSQFFIHRIDQNLPRHYFKVYNQFPDTTRGDLNYSNNTLSFTLPKRGFFCKAFLKHTVTYSNAVNATAIEGVLSSRIGAYAIKNLTLRQGDNIIEKCHSSVILERINTSLFNNRINMQSSLEATQNGSELTFYTPVLLSSNSDLNHFLDLKFLKDITLDAEFGDFVELGLDDGAGNAPTNYKMELMADYLHIHNYEDYVKKAYNKPVMMSIENSELENNKRYELNSGDNIIRLRTRGLIKKIILRAVTQNEALNTVVISDIKLRGDNKDIFEASNVLESILFSKNYQGLVSSKTLDFTDGSAEIDFSIPSFKNSVSGCLNADELHKDLSLHFNIASNAYVYVSYLLYDLAEITTNGDIKPVEENNTPYIEYDSAGETTKVEYEKLNLKKNLVSNKKYL